MPFIAWEPDKSEKHPSSFKILQIKLSLYTGCDTKKEKKKNSLMEYWTCRQKNLWQQNLGFGLLWSQQSTLAPQSQTCPKLTLTPSLWGSPPAPWAASVIKSWIGLVTITVSQNQAPLNVLLPWKCFNPSQSSAFHAAQDPPPFVVPSTLQDWHPGKE